MSVSHTYSTSMLRRSLLGTAFGLTLRGAVPTFFAVALAAGTGCEVFQAAPEPSIVGAVNGVLPDANAPLTVRFDKPIKPETLTLYVTILDLDDEGNLADERGDDTVTLDYLAAYFSGEGQQADVTISEDKQSITLQPKVPFPVGTKLAVVVNGGLEGENGVKTVARRRLPFGFDFKCAGTGSKIMKSGAYFFLLNVESPLQAQIQLYADLRIDEKTGLVRGQFTNADRLANEGKCTPGCSSAQVCETLPGPPTCIAPSGKAQNIDAFPDFIPNNSAPAGYSFTVDGCVEDLAGGGVAFATKATDLVTTEPPVTVRGLTVVSQFRPKKGAPEILEASGSGSGSQALLGGSPLGAAKGTILGRSLTAAETPAGIPAPPGL